MSRTLPLHHITPNFPFTSYSFSHYHTSFTHISHIYTHMRSNFDNPDVDRDTLGSLRHVLIEVIDNALSTFCCTQLLAHIILVHLCFILLSVVANCNTWLAFIVHFLILPWNYKYKIALSLQSMHCCHSRSTPPWFHSYSIPPPTWTFTPITKLRVVCYIHTPDEYEQIPCIFQMCSNKTALTCSTFPYW